MHKSLWKRLDKIFLFSSILIILAIMFHLTGVDSQQFFWEKWNIGVYETFMKFLPGASIGLVLAIIISFVPTTWIAKIFGGKTTTEQLLRASIFGVILDICSHGVLIIGNQLYHKGMKLSSTVAFLTATPWNSFSLMVIMVSTIGLFWTLAYTILSTIIAFISGLWVETLVQKGIITPKSIEELPHQPTSTHYEHSLSQEQSQSSCCHQPKNPTLSIHQKLIQALKDSTFIIRWLFVGILISATFNAFLPTESFKYMFGPTLIGLLITLGIATIFEVCSEGTLPLAIDIFQKALAKGNAFAFMMSGVATDFNEFMLFKEITNSKRSAFFIISIILAQTLIVSFILNFF